MLEIEKQDQTLSERKTKLSQKEYCWCLASFCCQYLLNHMNIEILYVDSDILFVNDPKYIFEEVYKSQKSIGLLPHRHFKAKNKHIEGYYNVGIVYFKNNSEGKSCAEFWYECASTKNNKYYSSHGTCGDQKYLELFEIVFKDGVYEIDQIGHGAPWNLHLYQYVNKDYIVYEGKKQILLFLHLINMFGK
jgi:hypothetical protein